MMYDPQIKAQQDNVDPGDTKTIYPILKYHLLSLSHKW